MERLRVLFADDDQELGQMVQFIFTQSGIDVTLAKSGLQALELLYNHQVDVIVLDVMMPGLDGFETARRMRQVTDVPIIFLTALGQEQDIVDGLECGAVDYIVKPFRKREFLARVRAASDRYRKVPARDRRRLVYEHLILDINTQSVEIHGRNVQLTPLEQRLLQYLIYNVGVAISKKELLENVWGYAVSGVDMNFIEAAIRRLRKKLDIDPSAPEYIQTVWGAGYRLGDQRSMQAPF